MANNNKKKNLEYFINEKERTITAILKNTEFDLEDKLLKIYRTRENSASFIAPSTLKVALPSRFAATVRCNEQDEWDVEKGKQIALLKVREHYMKTMSKILIEHINKTQRIIDDFSDLAMSYIETGEEINERRSKFFE